MFRNVIPVSEKLKQYIRGFTLSAQHSSYPVRYAAFPQAGTCLAFFNHTNIQIKKETIIFSQDSLQPPAVIVLGRLIRPAYVIFKEPVEEIAINFTASGINYFFETPFLLLATRPHQVLNNPEWKDFSAQLFSISPDKRITLLEAFLLYCLNERNKEPLQRITDNILHHHAQQVKELARRSFMSERNFLRYFTKYFGCSPSVYKKILRFRNALDVENTSTKNGLPNDILSSNYYYDSSHLRKDFLQLTGYTPVQFHNMPFLTDTRNTPFRLKVV